MSDLSLTGQNILFLGSAIWQETNEICDFMIAVKSGSLLPI